MLRAYASHLGDLVDAPYGAVIENDGLLANGCAIESGMPPRREPAEACLLEPRRAHELVVIYRLMMQKVGGCLRDHEHQLVPLCALGHEAGEEAGARVFQLDGAGSVRGAGHAANEFGGASVVFGAEFGVARGVGGEHHCGRGVDENTISVCSSRVCRREVTLVALEVRVRTACHAGSDGAATDVPREAMECPGN